MDRRNFFKKSFAVSAIGCASGFSLLNFLGGENKIYFRPPGALSEEDFLAACIRCGKCIQDCPYDTLILGSAKDGKSAGTPYINFRETPCYLCEDIPCIKACPTDALDHNLTDISKADLGTAVITDREACLSLNGIRCEICYRVCPLIDNAITLNRVENKATGKHTIFEPVVHKDACTGCGICENACPLDNTAITVIQTQKGDKAKHYFYLNEKKGVTS